ncbi:MAG: CHAT domain-containing protein [Thermoanaerobaculia bacterium]
MRRVRTLCAGGWLLWCAALSPAASQDLDQARSLHQEGRLEEALEAYRQVIGADSSAEDVATAANNACVLLNGLGRYVEAVELCRRALALRRDLGDARRLGRTLNNLGLVLQQTGSTDEAEAAFEEALAINREGDDAEGQAANLTNLGMLTVAHGRYEESLQLQAEALALADERPGEPWAEPYRATNLINRGVVLEKLGAYQEALTLYAGLEEDEALSSDRRAAVWANMATIYRNLGDPVRALDRLDRAAVLYEEQGNQAALSNLLLNRGLTLWLNYEDPTAAEAAFRQALERARESGDRVEEIQDLYSLGTLLLEAGRLDEAEEILAQCLELAEAAGSAEGRWSALEGLGRLARLHGDRAAALERFRAAMDVIESVREDLGTARRGTFFAARRAPYEAAAEVLAEEAAAGSPTAAGEALAVAHRAKARDLLDALGPAGAPRGAPPTVAELRGALGPDMLVEFLVTSHRILRWVAGANGIVLETFEDPADTSARVTRVHEMLEAGKPAPAEDVAALSARLLDGLADATAAHWWIAPDRRLHYLPFEILSLPGEAEPGLLIDRAEVAYLPTGSLVTLRAPIHREPRLGLVGLADPQGGGGADEAITRALERRFELGALPAARRELAAAARSLPGESRVLFGDEATEAALRSLPPGEAAVIHVAAHTLLDESSERGPAVVLSAGAGQDGLVFPAELAQGRFGGRLAVLAGCQTALGGELDGRALATLTGALLAGGAEGVVATLWRVDDEATATFMEQFYYYLGRGESPAAALRHAKLRLRASAQWNRPEVWSAYVLEGGRGPVFEAGSSPAQRWTWVGLGMLVVVLVLLFRRRSAGAV